MSSTVIKRQPTAAELEFLSNSIESVSKVGTSEIRVKNVKNQGHEVFNVLSQLLNYTDYTKGFGWGDFRMWFGKGNSQAAIDAIDGWRAKYASGVESGAYGPKAGSGSASGGNASGNFTYIIIGAAVLLIVVLLKRKKK